MLDIRQKQHGKAVRKSSFSFGQLGIFMEKNLIGSLPWKNAWKIISRLFKYKYKKQDYKTFRTQHRKSL